MPDVLPAAVLVLAVAAIVVLALRRFGPWRRHATVATRDAERRELRDSRPQSPGDRLRAALARTRQAVRQRITAPRSLTDREGYLCGIEEALIVADVGVRTTATLLAHVRSVVRPEGTSEDVSRALRAKLGEVFAAAVPTETAPAPGLPRVLLVAGVNGVGKTTTIGKLAARYVANGLRVLLVAADTFRAAAGEQLERWADRVGAEVIRQQGGADPAAVVVDGLRAARSRACDVVIIDTAGRLHTKANLMEELRKVKRVAARECPGAPHETLLVLDATTGQNGLQQAAVFQEALDLTGVVLTKMDGTARGGIAVAVLTELGLPVRFAGVGERPEDLMPFVPEDFLDALLAPDAGEPPLEWPGGSRELQKDV